MSENILISNHYPAKWEFARLTQAILDALPSFQRESLALSLSTLTSLSTEVLQRKVQILKGSLWMVASKLPLFASGVAMNEISFYRSQLGLPEEGSQRFERLSENTQRDLKAIGELMVEYASEQAAEDVTRWIPFVGLLVGGAKSFASTYSFLEQCLEKMEKTALLVLKEAYINYQID
ncbi:hypothetical protein OS493_004291 [Desmophyllum pertusum]|uniref:Uncharacterized protein n=1 Tax=Desmophyllum pertusum TaxID=174260 RepID=A0A9W9ZUH1_9CNID|nr:hypothetical protein OS493_004291 [Desmophyllum pertusum]